MNSDIKDIVESLKIHEKKEELKNKKEKLYNLSSEMSRMTFNREVGLYAFYTDEVTMSESTETLYATNEAKTATNGTSVGGSSDVEEE